MDIPEVVGVFDTQQALQAAFYDLRAVGFSRYDISLLADQKTLEEKLGKTYWRSKDLEDDPEAPRAAFVSEEAIGELSGMISGGFFFLGSYVAMLALPCSLDRGYRYRWQPCCGHRRDTGPPCWEASQRLLRAPDRTWRYSALGPRKGSIPRRSGDKDPQGTFRSRCPCPRLERVEPRSRPLL